MTVDEKKTICQALIGETAAMRLRRQYLGIIVDPAALEMEEFEFVANSPERYSRWFREYLDDQRRRITLDINASSVLCRLQLSKYIDLTGLYGNHAPKGWYLHEYTSPANESLLANCLSASAIRLPDEEAKLDWDFCFHNTGYFELELGNGPRDFEYILCNLTLNSLDEQNYLRASLITGALFRHFNSIKRWEVVHDLPFITGQLKMMGECAESVRRILASDREPNAETWCNTGAMVCDNLDCPEAALILFKHAIEQNPALPQPRLFVWIAGLQYIRQALVEGKPLDRVPEICETVERLGHPEMMQLEYCSYAGLAYGCLGDAIKARKYFEKALMINPNFPLTIMGMDALGDIGKSKHFGPAKKIKEFDFSHLIAEA